MTDLADFLLARIAEDEERGQSLVTQWFDVGNACQSCGTDGARVIAECRAKRRIVEAYGGAVWPVLILLALPFADHPDYRQEWRL